MRHLTLLSLLTLAACGGSSSTPPAENAAEAGARRDIDVAALKTDLDGGKVPLLVDVRTPGEFAEGHVPGAKNIPVDQLSSRMSELPEDQEVYLICRSGGRSSRAADMVVATGRDAVNIKGGTLAWTGAGNATE